MNRRNVTTTFPKTDRSREVNLRNHPFGEAAPYVMDVWIGELFQTTDRITLLLSCKTARTAIETDRSKKLKSNIATSALSCPNIATSVLSCPEEQRSNRRIRTPLVAGTIAPRMLRARFEHIVGIPTQGSAFSKDPTIRNCKLGFL